MEKAQTLCEESGKNAARLSFLLHIVTVLTVSVIAFVFGINLIQILQLLVLEEIILNGFLYVVKKNYNSILIERHNIYILTVSYISSIVFVVLAFELRTYNLWLIGGILTALLINVNLGVIINLIFTFLLGFVSTYNSVIDKEELILCAALGTILCLFIHFITDLKRAVYVFAIACSTNITLILVLHKFNLDEINRSYILYSLLSTILILLTSYYCYIKRDKLFVRKTNEKISPNVLVNETGEILENMEQDKEEPDSANVFTKEEENIPTSKEQFLNLILENSYVLKQRLRNYSEELCTYSEFIGSISGEAAERIGKNGLLAEAGGVYHKIGRIVSKDYVNSGVTIATKCGFPDDLISIIKEHNAKSDNPKSPEAAIVMLSDIIVSTIDYMNRDQSRKPVPVNQLIDRIFTDRLTKGCFDECGITVAELKELKKFYMEEFREE